MKIVDLLLSCDVNDVLDKISLHYGNTELTKYKKLYFELLEKQTTDCEYETMIHINAFEEGDEDDVLLEIFDENDNKIFFDVSAFVEGENDVYSISSSNYSDFLGYSIDEETLNKYSEENILAHCLYEITAYSFDDNV